MSEKKFKASEYLEYNRLFGYDKYKYLHELFDRIFECLPFDKKSFDTLLNKEQQYQFEYDGLIIYIDKQFNFFYAEIKNTYKLPLDIRIKLHEEKLKQLQKNIMQLKLF